MLDPMIDLFQSQIKLPPVLATMVSLNDKTKPITEELLGFYNWQAA
jgi:hypothetical protein